MFSHQDGHHSAVALLLKAAFIQVSDYRLLGASGSKTFSLDSTYIVLPNPSTVYLYCVTKSFHSLPILCYQILSQFTYIVLPNPSTVYLYCVTKSFHSLPILCYQILPQFTYIVLPNPSTVYLYCVTKSFHSLQCYLGHNRMVV
jgi:hypothetical protein